MGLQTENCLGKQMCRKIQNVISVVANPVQSNEPQTITMGESMGPVQPSSILENEKKVFLFVPLNGLKFAFFIIELEQKRS